MKPKDVYAQIKLAPPDLDRKVAAIMTKHVGKDNAIKRRDLVKAVFGFDPGPNLANSKEDRQIRESIARLQEAFPILSSSGDGGYWLPGSSDEIIAYAAEIDSCAMRMLEKSRRLNRQAKAYDNPSKQMELFA